MKIKKVINNNLVKSQNKKNENLLVMGCGLGFKKHPGDIIDEEKIEHVYVEMNQKQENQLEALLAKIPLEDIQIANDIVGFAQVSLAKKLDENIYITLTDHIACALERAKQGIFVKNALLWEIKRFYNHEFLVASHGLEMIEEKLGVTLPEDEAGFITLHLVGASMSNMNAGLTTEMTKIIQEILDIVKYHFKVDLDQYSLHYERFLTHLKFFVQRVFMDSELNEENKALLMTIKNQYQYEYKCALKVAKFIKNMCNKDLTMDELVYLTIHLRRITNN